VAGRPVAESVWPRAGGTARLGADEGEQQFPQPALGGAHVAEPAAGRVPIEARGALHASELVVLSYRDGAELTQQVKEGIRLCLAAGYKKADIAVVSFSGREKSLLFPYTQLGPHSLKTFTGRYDLLGQPLYSDGDVLLESVYRFKGQAAPAIVFAEIDFEQLDERAVRKLFVGATRAMMKLVLVVSERSAAQLLERLEAS
jgi:hypothetical protein